VLRDEIWQVKLIYLALPNVEMSHLRVAERISFLLFFFFTSSVISLFCNQTNPSVQKMLMKTFPAPNKQKDPAQ
jgi:hypothetical protein